MTRLCLLLMLVPLAAFGQQQPPDDPIGRHLIPPDLIMMHAHELSLSETQTAAVKSEVSRLQTKVLDLQWQMQEETARLVQLLQQSPVDESKVLERADKVMSIEREVKRAHLGTLIRLKNLLTPAQIAKLTAYRRAR